MATKQRSRSRRSSSSRDRAPRYVEPVLDPTWQSPYVPSGHERQENAQAVRRFVVRRHLPWTIVVAVVVVALIAAVVVSPWLPVLGVVLGLGYAAYLHHTLKSTEHRGATLGSMILGRFSPGGTSRDRQRLVTVVDRLTATFGVDGVSALIIEDEGYNAALVPNGGNYSLFVTSAVMRDFDLIELEGVVAHCLARQRLGLLTRESVAALYSLSPENRRALAGPGTTYRADEVAAAAIRYPLGLAGALRRCATTPPPTGSFFLTDAYARERWIWFNVWSDRTRSDLSDLDDVELRALALEEW